MKNLLLAFLFISSAIFSQNNDKYFGVQTHFGQYYRADMNHENMLNMLDSIKSAGIQLIRDECYWSNVELEKGVFSFPVEIDNYIAVAVERNIKVLLILDYNNPLYAEGAGAGITTEENRAAYAEYCKQVVSHYSAMGVMYYEIWNEPNIPIFWKPTPNAQNYVDLIKTAYPAIKEVNEDVTVLIGATSPAEGDPAPFINWITFYEGIKDAGGLNYTDAFSFHMYKFSSGGPESWFNSDLNKLKSIIGNDKEIWMTEHGYPTTAVWPYIDENEQAKYLSRILLLSYSHDEVKNITYYDLKNDGEDKSNNEHNFGLLNFDYTPKAAFLAYKTLNDNLYSLPLTNILTTGYNGKIVYNYEFNGDRKVNVLWITSDEIVYPFNSSSNRVKLTSMTGDAGYMYSKSSVMNIKVNDEPVYVQEVTEPFDIIDFEITPNISKIVEGTPVQFNFMGTNSDGKKVKINSPSDVQWSFSNSNAAINDSGVVTGITAGTGTLQVEFEGKVFEKQLEIIDNYSSLEINSFDYLNDFDIVYYNMLSETSVSINENNSTSGNTSLAIDYAFEYKSLAEHRVEMSCDIAFVGAPDSISVDLFNNGNAHAFAFECQNSAGTTFKINPAQITPYTGWQTYSVSLPTAQTFTHPAKLTKIIFYTVHNSAVTGEQYSGTVLIDNLSIHNSNITAVSSDRPFPSEFKLDQNYPNPFNPSTKIKYQIPDQKAHVNSGSQIRNVVLKVYDILGKEVATLVNGYQKPGFYEVEFNTSATGQNLASGIYFYSLSTGRFNSVRKMLLTK